MSEPLYLQKARADALERIKTSALPPSKYGLTITLNQPKIEEADIKTASQSIIAKSNAHLVDATVESEFDKVIDLFFDPSWDSKENDNKLTHLHTAYAKDVYFVVVKATEPVTTIELTHTQATSLSTIVAIVQHNAKAKLIINSTATEDVKLISEQLKIISGANSNLTVISTANIPKEATYYTQKIAQVGENSQVHWLDLNLGTSYTRNSIESQLIKPRAETTIKALSIANNSTHYDLFTSADHLSNHTKSNILTRGISTDNAKSLSRSLVKINENANGSEGYEKQEALILSKTAEADAIPNLEIHNHDVKCSHGSTIGRLDDDKLFYLMSRGLDKAQAQKAMIVGYFAPILKEIDADLSQGILTQIESALENK